MQRQSEWMAARNNRQLDAVLRGKAGYSVVFWDLECTSLSSMIGRVLCCSFKPLGKKPYTFRGDHPKFDARSAADDSKLVVAIRDELEKYDILVSHNGKLFDSKFLEGRLIKAGERPREKRWHVDTMWAIRSNLRISSKLDNAQQHMGLTESKTKITWDDWQNAGAGEKAAMDEVVRHCQQDVRVLEPAYLRLIPYIRSVVLG